MYLSIEVLTTQGNVIVYDHRKPIREKLVMPKDNITRNVFEVMQTNKPVKKVKTSKKNDVEVSLLSNIDVDFLDYFDKIIYSAFISAYLDQEDGIIKLSTIYRMLTGNKGAKITKRLKEDIMDSVERLATTRISVDFTNDVPKIIPDILKLDEVDSRKMMRTNLLFVETYFSKESDEIFFSVMKMPILYAVAHLRGQVLNIETKHLRIPDFRLGDFNNLNLTYVLYEEIDYVKHGKRNDLIRFDNLFKRVGIDITSKNKSQIKRLRDSVINKILPHWVKTGFICDFYIEKKGGRPVGIYVNWR